MRSRSYRSNHASHPSRSVSLPLWKRRVALSFALLFAWSFVFAAPVGTLAQALTPKTPHLTPKPHDDPAWHTVNYHAIPVSSRPRAALPPHLALTLLDETGRLARPVTEQEVTAWKHELHSSHTSSARAAVLHLWLGEYRLAHDLQPDDAIAHFRQAQHLAPPSKRGYDLPAYDTALALFREGAYQQSGDLVRHLLKTKSTRHGFDRQLAALWLRHAAAHAGYHAERAKLGIPEPPRLDPLCGAAALASSLRAQHLAFDKKTVLSRCKVTGLGSTLQDVVEAAQSFGLSAHAVTADDAGLKALPKPLICFAEHDHFISVIRADSKGVSYLCSDCGAWPGGRVDLSWKQWDRMEAGLFEVISRKGSDIDRQLSQVSDGRAASSVGDACHLSPLAACTLPATLSSLLTTGHIRLFSARMWGVICGGVAESQHCPCPTHCPTDGGGPNGGGPGSGSGGSGGTSGGGPNVGDPTPPDPHNVYACSGPSLGDPVNLATGEEEYTPADDLNVYNPIGPSASWSRLYNSLRGPFSMGYQDSDLGVGWSNNYNFGVYVVMTGTPGPFQPPSSYPPTVLLIEPNGAQIALGASAVPSVSQPVVTCTVPNGVPLLAEWDFATGGALSFKLTYADRTQFVLGAVSILNTTTTFYSPTKQTDWNGNFINFLYTSPGSGFDLLSSITDSNNVALLTFNRASNGNLTSVADRYNRSIYYHVGTYNTTNVPNGYPQSYQEVDHVSQIVATGTANPPDRYAYGYQNVANGQNQETVPFLSTITVPSPTGTGNSTATINYTPDTDVVSSIVDANGNKRTYTVVDQTHTKVTVTNPANTVIYSYISGFDQNMSEVSRTDGNGTIILFNTYASANDPYRPSQVQDGNGYAVGGAGDVGTWLYSWDHFGNMLTSTSPYQTVTTITVVYTNFALGEVTSDQEGSKQATTYTYFEPSGLTKTINIPLPGTVGGTQSVTYSYTYDSLGNVLTATTPGNNAVTSITTTYNYTTDGSYNQPDAIGQPLTMTDNLGYVSHYRYDSQGRLLNSTDPNGIEYQYTYTLAGLLGQIVRPATGDTGSGNSMVQYTYLYPGGPATQMAVYDESGTLVRQVTPGWGLEGEVLSLSGNYDAMTFQYDAAYRTLKSIDGNTHATQTGYSTAGYPNSMILANGDTRTITSFDDDGNPLQAITGRNITINYLYDDPESQLTDVQYPASTSLNVHVTYDDYGRKEGNSDATGSRSYNYDDGDRYTSAITTYKNQAGTGNLPNLELTYAYYPDGSRQTLTSPAGTDGYNFDGRGLLSSLSDPDSQTFSWTYLNNGWTWKRQSGNAFTTIYTYNALGWVTELLNQKNNVQQTVLSDFNTIHHDTLGNQLSITANIPATPAYSGSSSESYFGDDELKQESSTRNGGYTNNYVYDSAYNPTTFRNATQTFNSANECTSNGTTYDGEGNPASWNSKALTFDSNNQLTAIGSVLTAGYDAYGRRAWKQNSSGRTYFLYSDDQVTPICEIDNTGAVTAYTTSDSTCLLARHSGTSEVLYSFDPQGNTAQRLGPAGTVLSSAICDAFGVVSVTTGTTDPYLGFGAQWGYYHDSETGLYLLGARYYDPGSGRFLNRDPIQDGTNWYAYCDNNPLRWSDKAGLVKDELLPIIREGIRNGKLPPGTDDRYKKDHDFKECVRDEVHKRQFRGGKGGRRLSIPPGEVIEIVQDNLPPDLKVDPIIGLPVLSPPAMPSLPSPGTIKIPEIPIKLPEIPIPFELELAF